MFSTYQIIATSYGNPALSIHDRINDLHKRARNLAPRTEESAADSGCTDERPSDLHPRAQRAWAMVAEALGWNAISDDPELLASAEAYERDNMPYRVRGDWDGKGHYVMLAVPILPDTCCTQTMLTPGRHSTRCPLHPHHDAMPAPTCATCGKPIVRDSSYAAGWRHTTQVPSLHGAGPDNG